MARFREHRRSLKESHRGQWQSAVVPDGDERDQRIYEQARELGVHVLPTDSYVGLNRSDAEERAKSEGRVLVDRTLFWTTRRRNLSFVRVNVFFSDDGLVAEADAG